MDNDFYKNLMKRLPFGYAYHKVVFDPKGVPCDYIFLEVNNTFEKLTGLKAEDIINKKATVILPGLQSGTTDWVAIYGEVAINQSELDFVAYSEPLDTPYKVFAYSDKKGYFTTVFTYDPNHNFKTLFMNMNQGAVIFEVINDGMTAHDYIHKDINDFALSLEGKSREEIIGKSAFSIRGKIDDFGLINIFHSVWKTGIPQTMPAKIYPDEKIKKWYENQVIKLSKNEIVALYNDVTGFMKNQIDLESSRLKQEAIISSAPYGIFIADQSGNYVDVNPEACNITGYSHKELIGMNLVDITDDEYKADAKKHFSKLKNPPQNIGKGIRAFITKSGEKRYWSIKTAKLNENRYLGFTEDITEKLILENRLQQSMYEMKSLFDNSGLSMGYYRPDGTVIWYNKLAAENMGGIPDDFSGKSIFDLFPKENADAYMDRISQSAKSTVPIEFKDYLNLSVGTVCFLSTYNCIKDMDNGILGIQIISQDISELENSRLKTEKINKLLEETQSIAHVGSWEVNTKNNKFILSNEIYRILGLDASKLKLTIENFLKIIHPDDSSKFIKVYNDAVKGIDSDDLELRAIKPDGSLVWLLFVGNIKDSGGIITGSMTDITEQKQYVETIEHSLKSISQAESIAKLGFFNRNLQTDEYYWSDGLFNIFGLEKGPDTRFNVFMELVHADDTTRVAKHIKESLENQKGTNIQFRIRTNDEKIKHIHAVADNFYDSGNNPLFSVGIFQDVTEQVEAGNIRKQLEESITKKQRLESIGTLASGVAHEINNPLNGILNYGQLILDLENIEDTAKVYAKEIIHESERVAVIVKNLLDFSRQNKQNHSYANIEDIIGNTISLANTIIKHDQIDLQVNIPKNLSKIKCRSQQIQQVLMNLVTNARDALNEKYQGYHENKIINVTCEEFDKEDRKWIAISVRDNGIGVPDEIKEKIFDPFFSTKDKNSGTGLGLSISYGIVEDHHGEILLDTQKDEYTQFTVILPCDNGWKLE